MLLLMLLHKEDIEDLKQKTLLSEELRHQGAPGTHLLLADQTVVHRLVGAVAVESNRNVVLESKLLHQHGLLKRSHHGRLHCHVEIRIRDLRRGRASV